MKKIIKDVNEKLNKWLKENDFNCTVRFDEEFEYDYLNDIISYTLFDETEDDDLFLEVCQSIYKGINDYDDFIISFFHELGHYSTQQNITDEDRDEQLKLKENYYGDLEDKLKYIVSYLEWEATNWACRYIKDNPEKVKELEKILEDLRVQFFDLMKEDTK